MLFVKLMPWNVEDSVPAEPTYARISTITGVRHCSSGGSIPTAEDAGYHTIVDAKRGSLQILGEPLDIVRLIEESALIPI